MPLHQNVGEIFLANGSDEERAAFSASLERFLVKDAGIFESNIGTVRNELKVVLLLESPHIDEVGLSDEIHNRHPLAGTSGQAVTKVLMEWLPGLILQDNESIGSLVNRKHYDVRWLGIMNVSQLPFQSSAYNINDDARQNRPPWNEYKDSMSHIREKRRRCEDHDNPLRCKINQLYHTIIGDLRRRLELMKFGRPGVLLVCCGEVAQKLYEKADVRLCDTYVPHPSHNQWIYYLTLKKLKEQIIHRIR